MTLRELREILMEAGVPVAHYKTQLTERPYIVWHELATRYDFAGGGAWRETTDVSVDHFTDDEWDETVDRLKSALLRHKIMFRTTVIWYEDDEIIHTQFDFSVSREIANN